MPNVVGPDWPAEVASILVGAGERKHQKEMQKESQLQQSRMAAYGNALQLLVGAAASGKELPAEAAQALTSMIMPLGDALGMPGMTPEQASAIATMLTTPQTRVQAGTEGAQARAIEAEALTAEEKAKQAAILTEYTPEQLIAGINLLEAQGKTEEAKPGLMGAQEQSIREQIKNDAYVIDAKKAALESETALRNAQAAMTRSETLTPGMNAQKAIADIEYKRALTDYQRKLGDYMDAQATIAVSNVNAEEMKVIQKSFDQLIELAKGSKTMDPELKKKIAVGIISALEQRKIDIPIKVREQIKKNDYTSLPIIGPILIRFGVPEEKVRYLIGVFAPPLEEPKKPEEKKPEEKKPAVVPTAGPSPVNTTLPPDTETFLDFSPEAMYSNGYDW